MRISAILFPSLSQCMWISVKMKHVDDGHAAFVQYSDEPHSMAERFPGWRDTLCVLLRVPSYAMPAAALDSRLLRLHPRDPERSQFSHESTMTRIPAAESELSWPSC